jgi:large subunit ribosomal protein L21
MSYIVESGSKQYIVNPGQKFAVDRLNNVAVGDVIDMPVILAFGADKETKQLKVKVLEHTKGEKIRVVKFKSKSNYHRQYGFRPYLTVLEVEGGKSSSTTKKESPKSSDAKAKPTTKTDEKVEKKETAKKPKTTTKATPKKPSTTKKTTKTTKK